LAWARRPCTYQSRRKCHLRRTGSRWLTTWESRRLTLYARNPCQPLGKSAFGCFCASIRNTYTHDCSLAPSVFIHDSAATVPPNTQVTYGLNKRNRPEKTTIHDRREMAQMAGRSERGSEKAQFKARLTHHHISTLMYGHVKDTTSRSLLNNAFFCRRNARRCPNSPTRRRMKQCPSRCLARLCCVAWGEQRLVSDPCIGRVSETFS
jgi:hypothetical protein